MSTWLFNVYIDGVMVGRRGVGFLEDGREWSLPGLMHADDLVLCGESKEDLRVMGGRFAED